jgi:hypothetical protein
LHGEFEILLGLDVGKYGVWPPRLNKKEILKKRKEK